MMRGISVTTGCGGGELSTAGCDDDEGEEMKGISTTTLVGLTKIVVMLVLMGAWMLKAISWQEAVTAILFAQAFLSGIGFVKSQDADAEKPPNV